MTNTVPSSSPSPATHADEPRRALSYRIKLAVASALAVTIMRFFHWSYRYVEHGTENRDAAAALHPKGSFVLACWHTNAWAGMLSQAGRSFHALISRSFDGELIARCAMALGFGTVRGSSRRGGREALQECHRAIAAGSSIGITVDGPTGPRFKAKAGAVDLARRQNVAIVPFIAAAEKMWVFRSWDRFRLPKPFSRVHVHYGPPIRVADDVAQFEDAMAKLENELMVLEGWARERIPGFPG